MAAIPTVFVLLQERGITLDLGFSSFLAPAPEHIKDAGYTEVQYTLVDCPGHASLIRTIIGGAQGRHSIGNRVVNC